MPKIISFISRKGGTGKTTNAIHLATALQDAGHSVLLVETDTNYTLSTLRKMEMFKSKNNKAVFEIMGSLDHDVAAELIQLKNKRSLDYVIVDSAGKTTDEGIKKLCLVSDAVIIPTSLSPNDLLVTHQTVLDLTPARELKPSIKIMVLPNRIHRSTGQHTVHDSLKNLKAIILPVVVPQKNVYVNYSTLSAEKEYGPIAKAIINQLS